jgi:ribosomal protein S18 acetylase RimI-like enzyme
VTFNWDLEFGGRDAFLTELYLVASARGTGLGTHALRAIERASVALDVKALHLLVRPENTVARRLYAAAGYVSPPRLLLGKVFDSG